MEKMIPLITCRFAFRQHVGKLVLGVNIFDMTFGVRTDPIKHSIKSNSVVSGHMSHRWASSIYDDFDHNFRLQKCTTELRIEKVWRL